MGYDVKSGPSIAGQLKVAFIKIIQPFEEYVIRVKANGTPIALTPSPNGGMRNHFVKTEETPDVRNLSPSESPVTLEKVQAASEKLNDVLNASPAARSDSGTRKPRCVATMSGPHSHFIAALAQSEDNGDTLLDPPVSPSTLAPGEVSCRLFSCRLF